MKWAGLCFLVMAGGGIGCVRAAALHGRARSLRALCDFIDWLTREIRYTAAPLETLMQRAQSLSAFALLPLWQHDENRGGGFTLSKRCVKECCFTEEDVQHLCRFVEDLGKSDVAGQLAHGAYYATLFEERRKQAQHEAAVRGRVELMVWVGGAAVLALLWL